MIYADVKPNIKQQEIKELVAVSYTSFSEVPSKLEIQRKNGMYFFIKFWLLFHPPWYCSLTTGR